VASLKNMAIKVEESSGGIPMQDRAFQIAGIIALTKYDS